jgi:phage-related protein
MTSPGPGGGGLGNALIQVAADVRNFARGLQRDIQRELRRINWRGATASAAAAGRLAGEAFARGFGTAANNGIRGVLRSLKLLTPVLSLIVKGALAAAAALKTIAALAPAIAGLGQVLGAFAAALPALIVTGVLVGKTLSTAFKGVGAAMKAVAEGDAEALDAAMKDLTPSAQAFVREVAKIKPQFDALGKSVQEAFFKPFQGAFSELANPSVIGALQAVMSAIAADFGKAAASIAGVIGAAGRSGQLARIFAPLERSIARILTLAPSFTRMFLGLAEAAGPFIEVLSKALTSKLGGLIDSVNEAVASGGLAEMFESALSVMSAVGTVLADLGGIFSSVFGVLVGDGNDALGVLGELLDEVNAFLKTAEGVSILNSIRQGLTAVADILSGVIMPLLPVAFKLLGAVLGPVASLLTKLAGPISDFASALGEMLLPVIEELEPIFSKIGYELGTALVPLFKLMTDHLIQMAPVAAEMAEVIGPVLMFLFQALGDLLVAFLPLLQNLAAFLENNTWLFSLLTGAVLGVLFAATGAIAIITKIVEVIGWWQDAVADFIESEGIRGVIDLLTALVGGLAGAAIAIGGYWDEIVGIFGGAWTAIEQLVTLGVDNTVAAIASLPGKVASFAGGLYNSAVGLGAAIGRGLSNIGNFASEIGGKIVGAVKSGINAVIGSINRGIAQIDLFIPGSLPRMSFFERGGVVDEPTLAMLGERNKKEVVLPLTDPARTAALAEQSGLIELLRGSGAFGGVPVINVTAILDGFGVLRVVDQRIEVKQNEQGRELAFGTRGV